MIMLAEIVDVGQSSGNAFNKNINEGTTRMSFERVPCEEHGQNKRASHAIMQITGVMEQVPALAP
ncbi:hypothetical protein GFM44_00225 [Rhizobium leguminosarum bv. viciae]|nr:hypothetical protein [Rhizobium leguminosarum bv. viciae]